VPGFPGASIRFTVDGSEPTDTSPLYVTPVVFTQSAVLKAKAFQQDWKPSQTLVETYQRLAAAAHAVYVDGNGDGRIDGAVIRLDIAAGVPASVNLIDPFTHESATFASGYIGIGAAPDMLIVRFPDRQFSPGTAFATAPLDPSRPRPDSAAGPSTFPIRRVPCLCRPCP